jgi:hypothetical protein
VTLHLPSNRVLLAAGALALALLVALFWQFLVTLAIAGSGFLLLRHSWRRTRRVRRRVSGLPRWLQAFALISCARSARRLTLAQSGELHDARVEIERARASELRSRTEHRKRTREEQEVAERRAYIRGVADGESQRP